MQSPIIVFDYLNELTSALQAGRHAGRMVENAGAAAWAGAGVPKH